MQAVSLWAEEQSIDRIYMIRERICFSLNLVSPVNPVYKFRKLTVCVGSRLGRVPKHSEEVTGSPDNYE